MKTYAARFKYIFLSMIIAVCFIDCMLRGFPALPSNKADVLPNLNTAAFLMENFYAIFYFCFSLVFAATAICFGARAVKRNGDMQILFKASIVCGIFIFLSGIWILTDSRLLMAFSEHIDINGVILISFVSFMLMPVFFLECLKQINSRKIFSVFGNLFAVNTAVFLVLVILRVSKAVYLIPLAFHHITILSASVYFIVHCLRKAIMGTV